MKRFIALTLALLTALAACSGNGGDEAAPTENAPPSEAASATVSPPAWSPEDFPRLDGSTATIPLGQALAALFIGLNREEAVEYTEFSGTSASFEALLNYDADLLLVYEPPAETLQSALDSVELTAIGHDALVFLVNASNPVENLTTEQIRGIYTGEITNWKDVGGEDVEIIPYQRNYSSGSQTLMTKLVMDGAPMAEPPSDYIVGDMLGLVEMIASYDNGGAAIGYNVYYYVSHMSPNENVKLLSVDGVMPGDDTIGGGKYPFLNDYFAVIRKDEPEGSPARLIYDWICGEQGKLLLRREGYIPAG
jgi:phosphate transport system substrate-binding protein